MVTLLSVMSCASRSPIVNGLSEPSCRRGPAIASILSEIQLVKAGFFMPGWVRPLQRPKSLAGKSTATAW
ncbi:hypothetical protein D3C71_1884920 [compost metagenome]